MSGAAHTALPWTPDGVRTAKCRSCGSTMIGVETDGSRAALMQQLEGNLIVLGNLGGNHTVENPTAKQELVRKAWLDTRAILAKLEGGAA